MKYFRRLALVAVPVLATLGLSGVANAAPTNTSNVASNQAVALARAESIAARLTARAAAAPANEFYTNEVVNGWSSGLGVLHYKYGPHRYGSYDAVLPGWASSYAEFAWSTTAGWYTGVGYCTVQLRSDDDGLHWTRQYPDLGSGQHLIGTTTSYEVEPYRC